MANGFPYPGLTQLPALPGFSGLTFEGPVINGLPMPGQWLIKKLGKKFGWQEQQGAFLSGAALVPIGDPLVHVIYEVRLWEEAAFAYFRQLLGTVLKKGALSLPGVPASAALGIDDAALKDLGVTSVVVGEIGYPLNPLVASGGKGPWIGSVEFIQYRAPIGALPVPDQTIPDPGAVTPAASANATTAEASVAGGDAARDTATAQAFVPP